MTLRIAAQQLVTLAQVRAAENCACVTDASPDDDELGLMIDGASDAIATITGSRVAGRRQLVARPCRADWYLCPCCGLDGIPLGDDNPTVDEVKIDGTALDSSGYELHRTLIGWNLVKVSTDNFRPSAWPSAQSIWKPDTEDDTFSVTLTVGTDPELDYVIRQAALEIVCDMAAEQLRARDALEPGVVQATMGNVTVRVDESRLARIQAGGFGPATTRMMALLAPGGAHASTVWAPEMMSGWSLNLRLPVA